MEKYQAILKLINKEICLTLEKLDKLFIIESEEFRKIFQKLEKGIRVKSIISISRHLRNIARLIFLTDDEVDVFVRGIKLAIFPVFFEEEILSVRKAIESKFGKGPFLIGNLQKVSQLFYDLCRNHLRKNGEDLDVSLVSDLLGLEVIRKPERTNKDVLDKIIEKLEKLDPIEFNFRWLLDNGLRNEHYFLTKEVSDGLMTWDDFVESLPEKWKDRWSGRKYGNTFYSNLRKLRIFLEEKNPNQFNVRYLYLNCNDIWHYFYKNCRNVHTRKTDWEKVIRHLPSRWQKIWKSGGYANRKVSQYSAYYLEAAIDKLNSILEESKPKYFTTSFIRKSDKALYFYFVKRVRNEDGYVDWKLIISCLDKKWQKSFSYPQNLYFHLPSKFYENPDELARLIREEKLNLYLFFCPSSRDNRLECDKISRAIIGLIKGGNVNAYRLFMEYLEQITAFWIQNNPQLSSLLHSRRDTNDILKKCIFLFPFKKMKFLSYVYSALNSKAIIRRRETGSDLSLDDSNYLGISYHEIIANEDDYY